jgi:hypothetical protein
MDVTQLVEILKDEHPDMKVLIDATKVGSRMKELRPIYDVVLLKLEKGERFLVLSHSIDEDDDLEEEAR